MRAQGMAVVITSGGLGPTADDLTAEVVGRFCGREMVLDDALEARIAEILRPLLRRWPGLDEEAIREANRKQAVVPRGRDGARAGRHRAGARRPAGAAGGGPTVVVLPGPPRELQPMWATAIADRRVPRGDRGRDHVRSGSLRLFGIPESEIAEHAARGRGRGHRRSTPLEITTCLRRGEIEVVDALRAAGRGRLRALVAVHRRSATATRCSPQDGSTVDEQVIALLAGRTVAVAESCTGGLMSARLTDRGGSSAYFLGGVVAYSNEAKIELAGVDAELIERYGAVSTEVAEALADGAAERFGADIGIGITGIAGPGRRHRGEAGRAPCASRSARATGERITRATRLPGDRADVRDRSTTVAMHLLRRLLGGEGEVLLPGASVDTEAGEVAEQS